MLVALFMLCCLAIASSQWVKEMENDGMYEGDMLLTPEQLKDAKQGKPGYATTKSRHWPKKIYYDWAPELAYNKGILAAIADYHKYTCLRFEKRTNQNDYFYFFKGGGCYSGVGYSRGKQSISIGPGCDGKGTVLHEMAHRLGIYHEQSRPDRDNYIQVKFENIRPSMAYNFNKQRASNIDSLGTKYDYLSVMHYPDWAFSSNRKPTIITKDPKYQKLIGNRKGFSEIDKIQINRMYKCGNEPSVRPVTTVTHQSTKSNGDMFYLKHSGGKCLSVRSNNEIVFTTACTTKFFFNNGHLTVAGTTLCFQSGSDHNGSRINVQKDCKDKFIMAHRDSSGFFSLKKISTGKCVHPNRGSSNPRENQRIVIYSSCDEKRLKFQKI